MSTISSRRYFIAVALLVTAVGGALLRAFSTPESTPYYLGTLLLVMWLPIVGNVISFFSKKRRASEPALPEFSSAMSFVPQAVVELELNPPRETQSLRTEQDGRIHCLFILGTEGFTVRVSLLETQGTGDTCRAEVQFLVPATAKPKVLVGSKFRLMRGGSSLGTGQVLSLRPDA